MVNEPSVQFRFRRDEHLKGRREIREVFDKGKRFGIRGAKLFVLKNDLLYNRICFSFSRGFGNAVVRNRARRLGREAFRLLKPRLAGGHDLILLVYPEENSQQVRLQAHLQTASAAESSSCGSVAEKTKAKRPVLSDRAWQLENLFAKAGLLK